MITHSATETGQQKEQFGWMLQVKGKWRTGCWTKFEKGRWGGGGGEGTQYRGAA